MTPHGEQRKRETCDEHGGSGPAGLDASMDACLDKFSHGGCGPKVMVPVSALAALIQDPQRVYDRFVKGRQSEPTPAMISGELEHLARRMAVERLTETYFRARTSEDLRESYVVVHSAVTDATLACQRKYASLGVDLDPVHAEILNRLRIEEDGRVSGASNLLRDGVSGLELVRRFLPSRVEYPLQSESLGLIGRLDAVVDAGDFEVPLEYKTGRNLSSRQVRAEAVQVGAYCLLLGEEFEKECPYGQVYHTRYFQHQPVFVTGQLKRRVLELREKFLELCEGEIAPDDVLEEINDN